MTTDFDAAIVGAGAAGIAAARRFRGSGLSVVVVEASQRIGGRAWTQKVDGHAVDLGCGWLHSADRNAWACVGDDLGVALDRREGAYGVQWRDLGFSRLARAQARSAMAAWSARLLTVRLHSDQASEALDPQEHWNPYIRAMCGFGSGAAPERLSAADYLAYDEASTGVNWRAVEG